MVKVALIGARKNGIIPIFSILGGIRMLEIVGVCEYLRKNWFVEVLERYSWSI